jgi:hypothetical protein
MCIYFGDMSRIYDCYTNFEGIAITVPIFSILGLLTIFRLTALLIMFVFGRRIAARRDGMARRRFG